MKKAFGDAVGIKKSQDREEKGALLVNLRERHFPDGRKGVLVVEIDGTSMREHHRAGVALSENLGKLTYRASYRCNVTRNLCDSKRETAKRNRKLRSQTCF